MESEVKVAPVRRAKISTTVDARLLEQVDAFVRAHAGVDRSDVLDEALMLWWAREQDRGIAAQYADDERADAERTSWRAIRDPAAQRRFQRGH